jgi:hypothetical protein
MQRLCPHRARTITSGRQRRRRTREECGLARMAAISSEGVAGCGGWAALPVRTRFPRCLACTCTQTQTHRRAVEAVVSVD